MVLTSDFKKKRFYGAFRLYHIPFCPRNTRPKTGHLGARPAPQRPAPVAGSGRRVPLLWRPSVSAGQSPTGKGSFLFLPCCFLTYLPSFFSFLFFLLSLPLPPSFIFFPLFLPSFLLFLILKKKKIIKPTYSRNVRWWHKREDRPNSLSRLPAPLRRRWLGVRTMQSQHRDPQGGGNRVPGRAGHGVPSPGAAPGRPRAPPAAASTARRWARCSGARKVTAVAFLSARCLRDLMYFIRRG